MWAAHTHKRTFKNPQSALSVELNETNVYRAECYRQFFHKHILFKLLNNFKMYRILSIARVIRTKSFLYVQLSVSVTSTHRWLMHVKQKVTECGSVQTLDKALPLIRKGVRKECNYMRYTRSFSFLHWLRWILSINIRIVFPEQCYSYSVYWRSCNVHVYSAFFI